MITAEEARKNVLRYGINNVELVKKHLCTIEAQIIEASRSGKVGVQIDVIEPYEDWVLVLSHLTHKGFKVTCSPFNSGQMWLYWS